MFVNFAKNEANKELSMDVVSQNNYSFYFPRDWRKWDEEGTELAFLAIDDNGEQSGESMTLEISESTSKLGVANESLCTNLAQNMISVNPELQGQVKSAVVSKTHPTYHGCKIINSFIVGGIPTTFEIKAIWYKDNRDNKIYISNANYFDETSEDTVKAIKNSVNAFSIN